MLRAAKAAETAALKAKKAAIEKAKKEAAQRAKKKAAEQAKRTSDKAVAQTKKTGNPVQKQAQAKAAPKASSVSKGSGGGSKSGGSKPGGDSGGSSRSKGGSSGSGDSGKADGGGGESCDVGNSFVPGTKVLMADGSSKPIEEVEVGDKVVATDPETGETRIETVTAEIKGKGLKHLVKVVIDTDGDKGEATAEVTATDGHPFWVPELGQWLDATDLQPGQWLQTSAGTHVQITAIERWTTPGTTVHNLTVGDTHTYYVAAGNETLLVHNCGGSIPGHADSCSCDPEKPRSEVTLDRDSFEAARNTALDLVGPLDPGSRVTLRGRLESAIETFGKITGFTGKSGGEYREFRLDVDPQKGAHINVMTGKGAGVRKYAIRWPSSTVSPWLRKLQR
ncbi:hypothetical protein SUDANB21_02170 [Streptomyces sp. enrichment culture]